MGLVLDKVPGLYQLSKNIIYARVFGDRYYTANGTTQNTSLLFTTASTAGQTIIFTWLTGSVTFTCAASPDDSGTQFKDNAAALSQLAWINQTIEYINQNKDVYQNYIVSYINTGGANPHNIRIQSRTKDSNLALTITGTGFSLALNFGVATSPATRTNYELICETWLENVYKSGTYTKVLDQNLTPDTAGYAEFYLNAVLDSYVEKDFPTYNQDVATLCSNIQKRYYIRYGDKFGDPAASQKIYTSPVYRFLRGAVSHIDYKASVGFFNNYLIDQKNYLSFAPLAKKVSTIQQEYLYVMAKPSTTSLRMIVKVYYTSGASLSPMALITKTGVADNDVFIFPAGFTQLDLSSYETSVNIISKYEVYVIDQADEILTRTVEYTVDREVYIDLHYFLFTGPLNATETLRTTGVNVAGEIIERSVVERNLSYDYNLADGQQFQFYAEKTGTFKQNTGWKTKEEIDWIISLLLSDCVVEDVSEQFVPIIINKNKITKYQSRQGLYSLEFEYVHAFKSLAPEVALAGRIGYLIDSAGNYLVDANGNKLISI